MSATIQTATSNLKPFERPVVPIKLGWYGPQGSGKTTSAALLALALSKEVYGGAPVFVTDTEPGWQFLRPIFAIEGVELIQRTEPTFKAMTQNMREAQKEGACVWNIDTLTIIWSELMQSFKKRNGGYIPIEKWGDIREMWNRDYVSFFLNTTMCTQALGRLGNVTDEIQDENNPEKTKLVKMGTRFKAGGSEDFGYEPHLLLEVSTERKARVKAGSRLEGEGRIVHRVDVLKDRTWALNGKVIRWSDKPGYQKGGYRQVWESIKPHWEAVQLTAHVQIKTEASSQELITVDGDSGYRQRIKRLTIVLEELKGGMYAIWDGETAKAKEMRRVYGETLYQTLSWTAVEDKPLAELETCLKVHQMFREQTRDGHDALTNKDACSALITLCMEKVTAPPEVDDFMAPSIDVREKIVELQGTQVW